MSTATIETPLVGFAEADVQKQPKLACIGRVSEVLEGKVAQSGNYIVQNVKLQASGPGRSITAMILYRPEWLAPNFDPQSMTEADGGDNYLTQYRRHIAVKNGISTLKGLCGSEEAYRQVSTLLVSLSKEDRENPIKVSEVLREFLTVTNEDALVGYVLKQKQNKVGEDENGKGIYELANGYEVGEWFFPNADGVKRIKARANRTTDGSFKVAFDTDEF